MTFELVGLADDARLNELLEFAATVGTPRAPSAAAYRARMVGVEHSVAFVARRGEVIVAAALGTIMPMVSLDQVQVNAFCEPGVHDAFLAVLGAIDAWALPLGVREATAHVSDPRPAEIAAWREADYVEIGRRERLHRAVTQADLDAARQLPPDVEVVALAARPELEAQADALYRRGIADIPSALGFTQDDEITIRRELELTADDELPPGLLVATGPSGDVIAVAMLVSRPGAPTRAGHRLTTVASEWRGRGLARGIKVEVIRWAANNGITVLEASNDDGNHAMRRVNERLGYELDHVIVLYRRAVTA